MCVLHRKYFNFIVNILTSSPLFQDSSKAERKREAGTRATGSVKFPFFAEKDLNLGVEIKRY